MTSVLFVTWVISRPTKPTRGYFKVSILQAWQGRNRGEFLLNRLCFWNIGILPRTNLAVHSVTYFLERCCVLGKNLWCPDGEQRRESQLLIYTWVHQFYFKSQSLEKSHPLRNAGIFPLDVTSILTISAANAFSLEGVWYFACLPSFTPPQILCQTILNQAFYVCTCISPLSVFTEPLFMEGRPF